MKNTNCIIPAIMIAGVTIGITSCTSLAKEVVPPNIIIIFTDDHGYTDLGIHGIDSDVRTPNLDQLARDGVLFSRGYVTAPQCVPSRAGIITGRHQNAFGLDDNLKGPLSHEEYTIAERLRDIGYVTGMVGKWHLDLVPREDGPGQVVSADYLPHTQGFEEYFCGLMQHYHASHDLDGVPLENPPQVIQDPRYRIDIQTDASLGFLERRKTDDRPFFLYLGYFAPHSPIEEPPHYMERVSHVQEYVRQMALASVLAMDDGIGLIRKKLKEMGVADNTLIFYISDNGAPLVEGGYIGSRNIPMVGEKGMQTDGGQRVPFLAAWPGKIPGGQVFDEYVWSLDATATALVAAGASLDDKIEGIDLMPWLLGQQKGEVHEALYWRWRSQAAVLSGNWKFVRLGNERRYLFDMTQVGKETAADNKIEDYPEIADKLELKLRDKANTWQIMGLPDDAVAPDRRFFNQHVDLTLPPLPLGDGRTCAFLPWNDERPAHSGLDRWMD